MVMKSSSKHINKKEDLLTEKVVSHAGIRILHWLRDNIKLIGMIAGVIVLLGIIAVGWALYKKNINEKALVLEGKAFKLHQTVETETQSAQPEETANNDTTEGKNPYQEVIALYQQIMDQYPGTDSAERALFMLGNIEYDLRNYEQAQKYFSSYVSKYPEGKLRDQAEESMGYILEQQAKYQQALDTLKGLESKLPPSRKTAVLLAIARNYEALEKIDDAIAVYQGIVDSNTSFSWKNRAKERLDILQGASKENASVKEISETTSDQENSETQDKQ